MFSASQPSFAEDRGRQMSLLAHLSEAGYAQCEPPILQPASAFFESGEDMRGRLYLTQSLGGEELCLRPEFTIPVCRHYIGSPAFGAPAAFSYCGPVFRLRRDGPGEFVQAGIENFGRTDRELADAETLGLSLEAANLVAPAPFEAVIGDAGLFSELHDRLAIPPQWRRRLTRGLAQNQSLASCLAPTTAAGPDHSGVLAALAGVDRVGARSFVEDLLAIAGITSVGGRTVGEIAERFLEQAAMKDGSGLSDEQRGTIEGFLAIDDTPERALATLRDLARASRLDLAPSLERFERRHAAIVARVPASTRLRFAAKFVRNLYYYTGFVFEIRDRSRPDGPPLVGGGRYDRLMGVLGASRDIPAVGAALWADRPIAPPASPQKQP